jgi:hypothetical protein
VAADGRASCASRRISGSSAWTSAVLDQVLELVDKLRAVAMAAEIHGAGIGVPGPVSFREGTSVTPPIMPGAPRLIGDHIFSVAWRAALRAPAAELEARRGENGVSSGAGGGADLSARRGGARSDDR